MSKRFEVSNEKPDAVLQLSVIAYKPVVIQNQTATEMRSINTGSAQKPNFEQKSVPVVYELIHGAITGSAFLLDRSGHPIDSFKPVAQISKRQELTVNGQAPQAAPSASSFGDLNPFASFSKSKAAKPQQPKIETQEGFETDMLQELASNIQKRYVGSTDTVEISLALDPELRLGDKLAESNQWQEALQAWNAAQLKRNPSDRLYNMAVAKEALAYATYAGNDDLEAFLPMFQEAMDLYTQALHGDPQEKYMRQAVDRLQLAKNNIETARKMKVEQDQAAERAIAMAGESAKKRKLQDAALKDHTPDSPDEASFRTNVRTQLSEISGDVPDPKRDELVAFGQRLKLSEVQSYRVVGQEVERKKNISQAVKDYENILRPIVSDGHITTAERAQLRDLAKREDLDDNDVKSVESKFQFVDDSIKAPPSNRGARAPRTPKPPQ